MIKATITATRTDEDGSSDLIVELETDAPYNPDAAEDLTRRVLNAWLELEASESD